MPSRPKTQIQIWDDRVCAANDRYFSETHHWNWTDGRRFEYCREPPSQADLYVAIEQYEGKLGLTSSPEMRDRLKRELLHLKEMWDKLPPPYSGFILRINYT